MIETAAVVFYNNKKEMLLVQRTLDAPKHPGYWSFFGGHIEKNEKPADAAIREAKEELNIKLTTPKLLLISDHKNIRIYVFISKFKKNIKFMQKEGRNKRWFSIDKSLKLKLSPEVKFAIKKIKEYKKELK